MYNNILWKYIRCLSAFMNICTLFTISVVLIFKGSLAVGI